MKFIWICLCSVILMSCQPQKKKDVAINETLTEISTDEVAVNIDEFKEYFQNATFTNDVFHIHHYKWITENSGFKGLLIAPKVLKQYVDSTIFKINEDEQYYAITYIEKMDAFLVRIKISEANHMQQLFLLAYDTDKQAFVSSTKVASFFGVEGFINRMASWVTPKGDTYQVTMRNNNWSINAANNTERETDSIKTYIFDDHQFTPKSTVKTSEILKKQFPLED